MKQTLLVVVASAAIGAATALFFSTPAPTARPAPQLDVRTLQLAMERALESVGFGSQARAAQAPGPVPQRAASPTAETRDPTGAAAPQVREDAWTALPPADRQAIESLRGFDEDEMLRRTWLFRSERDVIAWLGTPDEASTDPGGERWLYNMPGGSTVVLYFARGRLLNIWK